MPSVFEDLAVTQRGGKSEAKVSLGGDTASLKRNYWRTTGFELESVVQTELTRNSGAYMLSKTDSIQFNCETFDESDAYR